MGSYPKPFSPRFSSENLPLQTPIVFQLLFPSDNMTTARYSPPLFFDLEIRFSTPSSPIFSSTSAELAPGHPSKAYVKTPESSTNTAAPSYSVPSIKVSACSIFDSVTASSPSSFGSLKTGLFPSITRPSTVCPRGPRICAASVILFLLLVANRILIHSPHA